MTSERPIQRGTWSALAVIGGGGQGTVYKATRVDPERAHRQMASVLVGARHYMDNAERARADAVRLADACRDIARYDLAENLGALKILRPLEGDESDKARARFKRELTALRAVKHPALVELIDAADDSDWMVLGLIDGNSLEKSAERFRGDVLGAARFLRPVIEAVAQLHAAGFVHRDIKPANILVRRDASPVLGDMGIVNVRSDDATRLTSTFESVGTTHFMPEWAHGQRIDDVRPAFDVFSLGKLLWCVVAGERRLVGIGWNSKDARNLTVRFPDRPEMKLINEILTKTVVNEESDCLTDAAALLSLVDSTIARLTGASHVADGEYSARCIACGGGDYELTARQHSVDLINDFGIPAGSALRLRAYECSHCGHVALFGTERPRGGGKRAAWS